MFDPNYKYFFHKTVLLKKSIKSLVTKPNGIYVDGTFGCGGHSLYILSKLNKYGKLIAIDKDPDSISYAKKIKDKRFKYIKSNFSSLKNIIKYFGFNKISGFLLDLGLSYYQLNNPNRGFSFSKNGPLDMRIDQTRKISALNWISNSTIKEIRNVIYNYGEKKYALKIAKSIFLYKSSKKKKSKINFTTLKLAEIISKSTKLLRTNKIIARVFQAIRIHINKELKSLKKSLESSLFSLEKGGRLVVLSFNSLEDRIVKQFIKINSKKYNNNYYYNNINNNININNNYIINNKNYYINNIQKFYNKNKKKNLIKPISRIFANSKEISLNPNSRSVIMRVSEII